MIRFSPSSTLSESIGADRLYWGVISTKEIARHRSSASRHTQLGYLFEHVLPISIEEIYPVFVPIPGVPETMLACGIERQVLDTFQINSGNTLGAVCPSNIPDHIVEEYPVLEEFNPSLINFLYGEYEPHCQRTSRRQRTIAGSLMVVVTTALVVIGLVQRTSNIHAEIELLQQQHTELYAALLGPARGPSAQPDHLRLMGELRSLRQTRSDTPDAHSDSIDLVASLEALCERWPGELPVMTESLTLTPQTVTIRMNVADSQHVQLLADALNPLPGWTLQPLQFTTSRDLVRSTLQFKRQAAAQGDAVESTRLTLAREISP
jgi:hypothetical protein